MTKSMTRNQKANTVTAENNDNCKLIKISNAQIAVYIYVTECSSKSKPLHATYIILHIPDILRSRTY